MSQPGSSISLPPDGPGFFYELIKRRLKKHYGISLDSDVGVDGEGSSLDDKPETLVVDKLKKVDDDGS